MKLLRRLSTLAVAALVLATPAACAGNQPGGTTVTPSASSSAPGGAPSTEPAATPSSPAPGATNPATTPAPGSVVLSSRVAYQWHWPNDASRPGAVSHTYPVPPVPTLVRIGAGDHPREPNDRPYNRMSFTFTTAMPGYSFQFVDRLVGDANDQPIPLRGKGVLRVTFRLAQAHTPDGTKSTITSQPSTRLGMARMVDYAQAGDYEAVLTYGIGIDWPDAHANPQIAVRACEVVRRTATGRVEYVVAIDVDAR